MRGFRHLFPFWLGCIAVALCLAIQPSPASDTTSATDWDSALPPAESFDWLQTTGGEWLKGELKVFYSGELEFDSDKFGLRKIDLDDVAQFLGHAELRVSIDTPEGYQVLEGLVTIDRLRIVIKTADGNQSFDRNLLISITPDATEEADNWSGKISFGLNYTTGNSEQTDKTINLLLRRRTPENRLLINYLGQTSEVNDEETVNNHRLNLLYDIYPERGFFWRPVFFEYYHDPFQNIDVRATLGAGAGYILLDTPGVTWNISGGPAYRLVRYDSVEEGEDDKATTPALVLGTFFDRSITSDIDFQVLYNFSIVNRESGTYTHQARATLGFELTEIIDFDLSLLWDRTRDPQPRADGSEPDQDDLQWLLTLGVEF